MKKLVLFILLITFIFTSCSPSQDGGFKSERESFSQSGEVVESEENESLEESLNESKTEDGVDVDSLTDMQKLLKVIEKVETSQSFYSISSGETKSCGIRQNISAKRYRIGKTLFKESVSYSFLVKTAIQTLVSGGKYLVRESEKISSLTEIRWSQTATDVGKTEYLARYGSVCIGLNNYILNGQTVTYLQAQKTDCGYVFTVIADPNTSTVNMVKEMKTNADSSDYPTFSSVKITIETDFELLVISARYQCAYEVSLLGGVKCEEDMTEKFYGFNQTDTYPEEDFFTKYC